MDHQEIRTLKFLEAIEENQAPSQRELAKRLNISLGLVNSFVKRLAHKGYFKVTTIPKNRARYVLTPKGALEKSRLTYAYITFSYQFYKEARRKLRTLFAAMANQGVRRIVFYGAGDLAEIAQISLQETPLHLVAIIGDGKDGEKLLGTTVSSPEKLLQLSFDRILITATEGPNNVLHRLTQMGIAKSDVVMLD